MTLCNIPRVRKNLLVGAVPLGQNRAAEAPNKLFSCKKSDNST